MKKKLKEFIQHLYHEIEDEEKAEKYLDNALPFIGVIVMYFNSLENSLDAILCENFTDRSDRTGLIVLSNMNYSSKVELNKQLDGYEPLINNLKESGRLRNLVVHANWDTTR